MGRRLEAGAAPIDGLMPSRRVRVYGPEGAFLGLAELLPDGRLQPRRLMVANAT